MYNPYKSAFQAAIAELISQEARRFYADTAIEHTFLTAAVMFIGIFKFIDLATAGWAMLKKLPTNNIDLVTFEVKALAGSHSQPLALNQQYETPAKTVIDIDFWNQKVEEILPVLQVIDPPIISTVPLLPAAITMHQSIDQQLQQAWIQYLIPTLPLKMPVLTGTIEAVANTATVEKAPAKPRSRSKSTSSATSSKSNRGNKKAIAQ